MTEDEMTYTDGGGFVGVYVTLSKTALKWSKGVIVAAIVGAFGWACAPLAALGPAGGAAATILAFIVGTLALDALSGLKAGKKMALGTNMNTNAIHWTRSITI
jgi:hypothetical protein